MNITLVIENQPLPPLFSQVVKVAMFLIVMGVTLVVQQTTETGLSMSIVVALHILKRIVGIAMVILLRRNLVHSPMLVSEVADVMVSLEVLLMPIQ